MKTKPFKIALIIITILISLYLWVYPYTSYEYVSNLEIKAKIDAQEHNQLYDSCRNYIYKFDEYVKIYPELQSISEQLDLIDKAFNSMKNDFDVHHSLVEHSADYGYLLFHDIEKLYQWKKRLSPLMYLVPKYILEDNEILDKNLIILQKHQEKILKLINDETIAMIVQDSFLLDIEEVECKYHKVHFLEVGPISNNIRLQIQQKRFKILQFLGKDVEEEIKIEKQKYEVVQPDFKIAKSKLKRGEMNTVEITTTETVLDDTIWCRVNNEKIPFKNGKAIYHFKANRKGKHEIEISFTFVNPFTKAYNTFKKSMKYEAY